MNRGNIPEKDLDPLKCLLAKMTRTWEGVSVVWYSGQSRRIPCQHPYVQSAIQVRLLSMSFLSLGMSLMEANPTGSVLFVGRCLPVQPV
jgi:hypothetical protein